MKKGEKVKPLSEYAEEKEFDEKGLTELFEFMKWLVEHGHTPKDKNFANLMAQYDVEKFAEEQMKQSDSDKLAEKQAPARFHAEPDYKPIPPPKPKQEHKEVDIPQPTSWGKPEEAGIMDKVKDTVKGLLPTEKPKEYKPLPPLTKKTMRRVIGKIRSGV